MHDIKEQQARIDSCRDNLLNAMIQANERAKIGKENEVKASSIDTELQNYINTKNVIVASINHLTSICKNIQNYANKRKELAENALKLAISKAGYIVPDADIEGIQLNIEDKKACVVDGEGNDINLKEGSAYRTVMGVLIKYTLIKEKPGAIQALFFDEQFATLSDETINIMKEYLSIFQKDMLIVGIEQRDVVFYGLDKKVLEAIKDENGVTTIIDRGESSWKN